MGDETSKGGKFLWVGNDLSLDFVNTTPVLDGRPVDLLELSLDADALFSSDAPPAATRGSSLLPFPADIATITRAAARAMVEFTGGNKSEAARRLDISRPRLNRLLDENTP